MAPMRLTQTEGALEKGWGGAGRGCPWGRGCFVSGIQGGISERQPGAQEGLQQEVRGHTFQAEARVEARLGGAGL